MNIKVRLIVFLLSFISVIASCNKAEIEEVNIGFIAPMSGDATDLGIAPSKAMQLAIDNYNAERTEGQPKINLFVEDGKWDKEIAVKAYEKLRKEHNIDIIFISNTDGTIKLQEKIMEDGVIAINPVNNDKLLASLNDNTFTVAKSTEEAHRTLGIRMIELGLKNVAILHFPNQFMTLAANSVKEILNENGSEISLIQIERNQTDFTEILKKAQQNQADAYVFLGYKDLGFAMKQAREMGIKAPFFGSPTLLDAEFFSNSNGAIIGTEFTFFTPLDGNYILANEFLENYEERYNEVPFSVWAPMQAYDAMNIVINELKMLNENSIEKEELGNWLRDRLFQVKYYQGICGNISILEDGSSRGIYFSLYKIAPNGELKKIKR